MPGTEPKIGGPPSFLNLTVVIWQGSRLEIRNSHGKSSDTSNDTLSDVHYSQHYSNIDWRMQRHMLIITSSVNTEASTSTVIIWSIQMPTNVSPSAGRTRRSVFHRAGASVTAAAVCIVSKQLTMREFNFVFPAQHKTCACITSQLYNSRGE